MKSFLGVFSLFALISVSSAVTAAELAAPAAVEEASCWTRNVADAGYRIRVTRNPETRLLTAHFASVSIFGTQPLSSMRVEESEDYRGKIREYRGAELEVVIDLGNPLGDGIYSAKATGKLVAVEAFSDLTCSVHNPKIREPLLNPPHPFTCMAFWSGSYFDVQTGACKTAGRSGCSNPFEFRSLEACQNAYSVHSFR